jgi:nitrite reductase/ring-hydroxylating ferredoxin subunit
MAWRKHTTYQKDLFLEDYDVDDLSNDASFVLDPAKLYDELPQPFRLVDKTVDYVFDKAWEAIQEIELRANELGLGGKLPVFDHAEELSDLSQATLMCSSLDGKFVFVVAKNGVIYALDAETSCVVAHNDELQGVNMKTLSTGCLEQDRHLVCALVENG